jgi:hydroxypyruvate reductase
LPNLDQLRRSAREIFDAAIASVDPREAVKQAIVRDGPMVEVCGERFDASAAPILAVAIGKAAGSMALGVEDALGDRLTRGVISAPPLAAPLSQHWEIFEGGHPLPNEASLEAAEAAFNLLDWANDLQGVVICLISGGGSAMFEWPMRPAISLDDLRRKNELLIASGARISEINEARRAFSAVKGGRLLQYAPNARFVTLIVSDTNRGDEANVASGPTLSTTSPYQVLLGNWTALEAARQKASELGFTPTIAHDICEQPIQEGCDLLLASRADTDCLISGGEFSCPVRGPGRGGRNLETVLRLAMNLKEEAVVFSAGTDGIDGNSPAAGAFADQTTVPRARSLGLDPGEFLARSDSYTFFEKLGDLIVTGPTGTNVRDLRFFITSLDSQLPDRI